MQTLGRDPHVCCVADGRDQYSDAEKSGGHREELMGSPAPTRVPRALGEPRASASLGRGKGKGRGAKGVGPSHCEQGNGQQGKSISAKTIPYRSAGEPAEEGKGDQDAGGEPGRGSDSDCRSMGSKRHPVREREECEEPRHRAAG